MTNWPRGVFRRSYVRAYAQAIGLEPDSVVREFLGLYPDPPEDPLAGLSETVAEPPGPGSRRRPPTRFQLLIDSALGALRAPAVRAGVQVQQAPIAWDDERLVDHGTVADGDHESSIEAPADSGVSIDTAQAHPPVSPSRLPPTPALDLASLDASLDDGLGANPRSGIIVEPESVVRVPVEDHRTASADRPAASEPEAPIVESAREASPAAHPAALATVARLCARLARVGDAGELASIVAAASSLLGASGLILWMWDERTHLLQPTLSHGFADELLAQVGGVPADADNAISLAFRSGDNRLVPGNDIETGALVVPLATPWGCVGVLAFEFRDGGERRPDVESLATILGAQLSALVGYSPDAKAATA